MILFGLLIILAPMILVFMVSMLLFALGFSYISLVREARRNRREMERMGHYFRNSVRGFYSYF